jgi:hypothetical protein
MGREYRTREGGEEGIEDLDGKSEGKKSLGRFRRTWDKILKWILVKNYEAARIRLSWLRIGTSGGLL